MRQSSCWSPRSVGSSRPTSRSGSKARLPPLAAGSALPQSSSRLPEDLPRRSSGSVKIGPSGIVARRRTQVDRLDPLCHGGLVNKVAPLAPGGGLGNSLSAGSLWKAAPGLSSGSSASASKAVPEGLGPLKASLASGRADLARVSSSPLFSAAQSSSQPFATKATKLQLDRHPPSAIGGSPSKLKREIESPEKDKEKEALPAARLDAVVSDERSSPQADARGSALAAELGGASTSAAAVDVVAEKNAIKCKAVASLQRLFFEEVERGGDANAAAAAALKRLAEETRPPSRLGTAGAGDVGLHSWTTKQSRKEQMPIFEEVPEMSTEVDGSDQLMVMPL
eukprot:TRINITY_DN53418_c0_g1_i1.p1 TRINITY_DN53418_c0_g1~~TRINITY_DN53418_c0_g1_i1.p1  ORF type:complete len:338 (-),score=74.31 TRINITY_DN53418_c0_g1_i1:63-1076(-)